MTQLAALQYATRSVPRRRRRALRCTVARERNTYTSLEPRRKRTGDSVHGLKRKRKGLVHLLRSTINLPTIQDPCLPPGLGIPRPARTAIPIAPGPAAKAFRQSGKRSTDCRRLNRLHHTRSCFPTIRRLPCTSIMARAPSPAGPMTTACPTPSTRPPAPPRCACPPCRPGSLPLSFPHGRSKPWTARRRPPAHGPHCAFRPRLASAQHQSAHYQ